MKTLIPVLILITVALCSCSTVPQKEKSPASSASASTSPKQVTQDGLSLESAIVIQAQGEGDGVAAEYAWIRNNLPGARPEGQALLQQNGKPYDLIHVRLPNGERRDVYFEISSYFGKF